MDLRVSGDALLGPRWLRWHWLHASYDVVVAFKSCLSGGCSKDLVTSCSVTESGGALQVTSEGSYVELDKGAWGGCDADCRLFSATCTTPVLPAGDQVSITGKTRWC